MSSITDFLRLLDGCAPLLATGGRAFLRTTTGPTFAIRSSNFRQYFFALANARLGLTPSHRQWSDICRHLEGEASHNPDHRDILVSRRVAPNFEANSIHIDISNNTGDFIEVTPTAWRIVTNASISDSLPFETSPGARALIPPEPADDNSLDRLRTLLNLGAPDSVSWLRTLTWLLCALRPEGPYPILVLRGPAASGKTIAGRILRSLIDNHAAPFTPTPRSSAQLLHLAHHNWVLAFDQVSHLSPGLADTMCRITSGAGLALKLDDHDAPVQQTIRRPILLVITPDCTLPKSIADRALFVDLPPLESPQPEPILVETLAAHLPKIFGALCDLLSKCLAAQPAITATSTRHVTAVSWAAPAHPGIPAAVDQPEPPPAFVLAIADFLRPLGTWTGTVPQLLLATRLAPNPNALSRLLTTHTLTLHDHGIEFTRHHKKDARLLTLRNVSPLDTPPPQPQSPQLNPPIDMPARTSAECVTVTLPNSARSALLLQSRTPALSHPAPQNPSNTRPVPQPSGPSLSPPSASSSASPRLCGGSPPSTPEPHTGPSLAPPSPVSPKSPKTVSPRQQPDPNLTRPSAILTPDS